jgi:hypothetical protein
MTELASEDGGSTDRTVKGRLVEDGDQLDGIVGAGDHRLTVDPPITRSSMSSRAALARVCSRPGMTMGSQVRTEVADCSRVSKFENHPSSGAEQRRR